MTMAARRHSRSRIDIASATDGELIELARSGNTEAFGELWVRHERSARAMVPSSSERAFFRHKMRFLRARPTTPSRGQVVVLPFLSKALPHRGNLKRRPGFTT